MITLRLADFSDVFVELIIAHAPVIKSILPHGRVVGKTDLREAEAHGVRGIFGRFAGRMATQRSVHMIISGQRHWEMMAQEDGAGKGIPW